MLRSAFASAPWIALLALLGCGKTSSDDDAVPPTVVAGSSANGGASGASSVPGGGASAGEGERCMGTQVQCVDATTVRFCNTAGFVETVACDVGMAQEGIISSRCESDAQGDGCTVDAFMDPGCAEGTPAFAVCANLREQDLLDVYVACYSGLDSVRPLIDCYASKINAAELTIDCGAASSSCGAD